MHNAPFPSFPRKWESITGWEYRIHVCMGTTIYDIIQRPAAISSVPLCRCKLGDTSVLVPKQPEQLLKGKEILYYTSTVFRCGEAGFPKRKRLACLPGYISSIALGRGDEVGILISSPLPYNVAYPCPSSQSGCSPV